MIFDVGENPSARVQCFILHRVQNAVGDREDSTTSNDSVELPVLPEPQRMVITLYYMHTQLLLCPARPRGITRNTFYSRGRLSFESEEKRTKVGSFYTGKAGLSSLKRLASLRPSGFCNKIE